MAVFQLQEDSFPARPAPGWFVDWVRLGLKAADWCRTDQSPNRRRVVVVSAPTEAMAAAATAFGFIRASYLQGWTTAALGSPGEPLELLAPGTWIWFRAGRTARTAKFLGVDERDVFKTSNGHFRRAKLDEVRVLPAWLSGSNATADCQAEFDPAFLKQLLRASEPTAFAHSWSTRVLIVGSVARINEELDVRLGVPDEHALLRPLRHIVRPLAREHPAGCQSVITSSRDEEPLWEGWAMRPALTILRGAYATSRWLPQATADCVVAVLGRAEAGLEAALATVMQARAYADPISLRELEWQAPRGCEVLAFDEAA